MEGSRRTRSNFRDSTYSDILNAFRESEQRVLSEIKEIRTSLDTQIVEIRREFDEKLSSLSSTFDARFAELKAEFVLKNDLTVENMGSTTTFSCGESIGGTVKRSLSTRDAYCRHNISERGRCSLNL